MTRKDYELIARAVALGVNGNTVEVGSDMYTFIHELANALEQDNPRFDRSKFLTACGL